MLKLLASRRSEGELRRTWLQGARAAIVLVLVASLLSLTPTVDEAGAQGGGLQTLEVWGISGGSVANPKQWRYRQSVMGDDLGSHTAADPDLDDSTWGTKTLRWREIVGANNANHFRKDFDLLDLGIAPFQVVGIQVRLQYDDAAVMYLNGEEVYRTIRGNLLPNFATHPVNTDMAHNVPVTGGGFENFYVNIPDPDLTNACEEPDTTCANSPYGSPQPPAVPTNLLVEGTNTWSITTWNQSGGGSGDSSLNHVFELIIDENALPPPTVQISEVMASNDTAWLVNTDGDPELESPDWIELWNFDADDPADISGWTLSDSEETWTIPAGTVIAPNDRLMIAATGEEAPPPGVLQASFKLSSQGDEVKLTTSDGVVADFYEWTDQFTDNSVGRANDTGEPTYLASPTPDQANNVGPLTQAPPVLRTFRDRMFNPGEQVDLQLDAFDPDGDPLTFAINPLPNGMSIDPNTGAITGTADFTNPVVSQIVVTDGDNDTDDQPLVWNSVGAPLGPSPLVLNEYNAVPNDGELNGGSELGNGGDWFEFLVVEDNLDLRGYTIEFRQRDPDTDQLRPQVFLTFADRDELRAVPAGTIITIAQDQGVDDLSFDADQDWSILLDVDDTGVGAFFEAPVPVDGNFNSTRRDQTVLIRNAAGDLVTPLAGETDGWDAVNGGVGESEVMNLCRDIETGDTVDPVADYRDDGQSSTIGEPNVCIYPDPLNPGSFITDPQDLTVLRASASLGAGSGDVNCDGDADVVDALLIARLEVGILTDTGPCLLDAGGPGAEIAELAGDVTGDGQTDIVDALVLTRCAVGLPTPFCE
ncbi:MAG: lamin tail domain-containing protein [Actinomycetota bacterium]